MVDSTSGTIEEIRPLESFFRECDESIQTKINKVIGTDYLKANILLTPLGELLLTMYGSWWDENERKNINVGYSLYSNEGSWDKLEVIENLTPTSAPALFSNNNVDKVLVPTAGRLDTLIFKKGSNGKRSLVLDKHYPEGEELDGKIQSISSGKGIILCTEDHDGYLLIDERSELVNYNYCRTGDDFDYLCSSGRQMHLPSSATSSLIVTDKDRVYTLVGLDDSILSVCEIKSDGKSPILSRQKNIQVIPDFNTIHETNKNNPVYGLGDRNKFIQCVVRNMFIQRQLSDILEPKLPTYPANPAGFNDLEKYLCSLKEDYHLDAVRIAPHRITCWDWCYK